MTKEIEVFEVSNITSLVIPRGYYRNKKDGEIVYLGCDHETTPDGTDNGAVRYVNVRTPHGKTGYWESNWDESFEGPFDASILEAVEQKLTEEMFEIQLEARGHAGELGAYKPHMLPTGEANVGTGLVPVNAVDVREAKKGMKLRANEVEKVAIRMQKKSEQLASIIKLKAEVIQADLDAKMAVFQSQICGMQQMLEKAQEALWTINLYLGTSESIFLVRDGKAAPVDEMIRVQQRVLYMDEECAIVGHEGGINFQNINKFEEWLMSSPDNLAQICPFEKGIVAMKPRRNDKDYSRLNIFVAAEMKIADKQTYFLFRNGENLYSMTTEFAVGSVLVPRRAEFLEVFPGVETVGDEQYMELLKRSAGLNAHWLRVGLIIQGVIDRTTIFHPITHRPNILMAGDYGVGIEFVNDAETMLSEGVPSWDDYLKEINSKLEIGCRVVGFFGGWGNFGLAHYQGESRRGNSRITPNGAGVPDGKKIHTIDGKSDGYYTVKFKRTNGWRDYEKRATCRISPSDNWIINLDAADPELLKKFLRDRDNRHEYEQMFPVIQHAITAIEAERAEEEPFRRLLLDHLQAQDSEITPAELEELISWYKFKNKHHRTLTAEDSKAYKMITTEYANTVKRREAKASVLALGVGLTEWVLVHIPDVLLVAHVDGSEWRVIARADNDDVFVHEYVYKVKGDSYLVNELREWRILDNRSWRWTVAYKDAATLKDWHYNANPNEYLTGPDKEILIPALIDHYGERLIMVRTDSYKHFEAVTWSLGEYGRKPELDFCGVIYEKNKEGIKLRTYQGAAHNYSNTPDIFDVSEPDVKYGGGRTRIIHWQNAASFEAYKGACSAWRIDHDADKAVDKQVNDVMGALAERRKAQIEKRLYDDFIAEHGDLDLWEGHKKQFARKLVSDFDEGWDSYRSDIKNRDLRAAIRWAVESNINIEGMTVKALIIAWPGSPENEQARVKSTYGYTLKDTGNIIYRKCDDVQDWLQDWVI